MTLSSAFLPLLITVAPTAAEVEPFAVFSSVCLDGKADFAPGTIEEISPDSLPRNARQLAMISLWSDAYDYSSHRYASASELPDRLYEVATSEGKVVLMSPDEEPENPIAASCSVLLKGNDVARANGFLAMASGGEPKAIQASTSMISYDTSSHRLVASSIMGWTILSAVPNEFVGENSPAAAVSTRTERTSSVR